MGLGTFFKNLFKSENQIKSDETFKRYHEAKDKLKQLSEKLEEEFKKDPDNESLQYRLKIMNNISDKLEIIHNNKSCNVNSIEQDDEVLEMDYTVQVITQHAKDEAEKIPQVNENFKVISNSFDELYFYELNKPRKDGLLFEGKVFFRKDLKRDSKDRTFEKIEYHDLFTSSNTTMQLATMIMFVDDNGNTKIIKNRYGRDGIVK